MAPPLRTRNAVVRGPDPRRFDEALRRYRPVGGHTHARRAAAAVEGLLRQAAGFSVGEPWGEGGTGSSSESGSADGPRPVVRVVSKHNDEGASLVLSLRSAEGRPRRLSEHVAFFRLELYDRSTGAPVGESRVRVGPGAVYAVARIRRPEGARAVRIVVRLEPSQASTSFTVSPELRGALEGEPTYARSSSATGDDKEGLPLEELSTLLWLYIKGNRLQDKSDPSAFGTMGALRSAVGGETRLRFRDALGCLVRSGAIAPVAHAMRLPDGFEEQTGSVCEAELGLSLRTRPTPGGFRRGRPARPAPCPKADDTAAEELSLLARKRAEEIRLAACEGIANAPHRFLAEFIETQQVLLRRAAG